MIDSYLDLKIRVNFDMGVALILASMQEPVNNLYGRQAI